MEVKREPEINKFEGGDREEEKQDVSDEHENVGTIGEDGEKRVLHAGYVDRAQSTKEKHAQALRDFVQAKQGKGDEEELRLDVAELQSAIFRTPKRISTPQENRLLHWIAEEINNSKWIKQFDIERSTQAKWSSLGTMLKMTCTDLSI